jgi:hypothetical protein
MIEIAVLVALFIFGAGAAAKLYEWRQDVLYGPYLERDDRYELR